MPLISNRQTYLDGILGVVSGRLLLTIHLFHFSLLTVALFSTALTAL